MPDSQGAGNTQRGVPRGNNRGPFLIKGDEYSPSVIRGQRNRWEKSLLDLNLLLN